MTLIEKLQTTVRVLRQRRLGVHADTVEEAIAALSVPVVVTTISETIESISDGVDKECPDNSEGES